MKRAQLLSTDEAAEIIGCTREAVAAYCRTGKLPAVRIKDEWRIPPLAARRFRPGSPGRPPGSKNKPKPVSA